MMSLNDEHHEEEALLCKEEEDIFSDREVRFGFIRKVYAILSCQLTFTALFALSAMYVEALKPILLNPALIGSIFGLYIVSICALVCCGMHNKVPVNYLLLSVFTFCVSWLVGVICMAYDPIIVFEAAGLTAAIVIALTIYAFTTKNDFTLCGPVVFILGMLLLTGGLFMAVFGFQLRLVWTILGCFIFSFYIIYDTQMIMGGKRRYQMSIDSYILASVLLYLDIINLFLEILKLLGNK
jgi:FtsH-binding integral membrane protein